MLSMNFFASLSVRTKLSLVESLKNVHAENKIAIAQEATIRSDAKTFEIRIFLTSS
jgi:hypothetical protein